MKGDSSSRGQGTRIEISAPVINSRADTLPHPDEVDSLARGA